MKRLLLIAALAVILLPGILTAQEKVGTAGANFLQIGVSPRAVAMGEAFLPIADDVSAAFYNPGGLSLLQERQLFLSHLEWPANIQLEYAAFGMPTPNLGGVISFSTAILHMDDMEVTTPFYPNGTGQTFTASDYMMGLSYSRFLTDKFAFGVTVKYIQLYAHDISAGGWSADVGTYYDTGFKSMKIAMAVTNFGPDMEFITEKFPLPINFSMGFSMEALDMGPHRITTAFVGSHPSDNAERYNIGVEYLFNNILSLRAGYKVNYDNEDFSFGGGLQTSLGTLAARLDYAYVPFEFLEESHRFSLNIGF